MIIFIMLVTVLDVAKNIQTDTISATSYQVTWDVALGNFSGYIVECNCSDPLAAECDTGISTLLEPDVTSHNCSGLTQGTTYKTYVRTVRDGWADQRDEGTGASTRMY